MVCLGFNWSEFHWCLVNLREAVQLGDSPGLFKCSFKIDKLSSGEFGFFNGE
jgi:hypothetical protein